MRIRHTKKRKQRGFGRTRSRASPPNRPKPEKLGSPSKIHIPEIPSLIVSKKPLSVSAQVFVPSGAASLAAELVTEEATSIIPVNSKNNVRADVLVNSIALDCEMVGVGPRDKSELAQIAIVDFWGNQLYNEYVIPKEGIKAISNYRTKFSGITKEILEAKGRPFNDILKEVKIIIADRTIVGHGLDSDFSVLGISPHDKIIWDTAKIPKYQQPSRNPYIHGLQPRKLKALTMNFTGNNIQKNEKNEAGNPKGHSPLEDARAAMNLYRVHHKITKITYKNMSDPSSSKDDPYFNKLFMMAIESIKK